MSCNGRRCGLARYRRVRWLAPLLCAFTLLLGAAAGASASTFERRPVLFVHGVESAGSNFASQQMRFESNGYPHGWVEAIDYNSLGATAENYNGEVEEQIEKAIAALKQRTGKSQVDVVGHSEGTKVMYHYLAESEKAAEHRKSVAAYVNLDGQEKNPGVRTLAVWAQRSGPTGSEGRHMEGAEKVTMPDMTARAVGDLGPAIHTDLQILQEHTAQTRHRPAKIHSARREGTRIPAEHGAGRRHRGSLAAQLQRRTDDQNAHCVIPDH
jgi:pimeloyl-ACP methyl ester carboxylesterase